MRLLTDATVVLVTVDGEDPSPCTWRDFCEANPDEWVLVGMALESGRVYGGGGGAAPAFTVAFA